MDNNNQKIWEKFYGESFLSDSPNQYSILYDSTLLLAGTQGRDFISSPISDWESHFYFVVIDQEGNVLSEIVNDSDIKDGLVSEVVHYKEELGDERLAFASSIQTVDTLAGAVVSKIRNLITDMEGNILHSTEIGNDLSPYNYLSYNQKVADGFIVAGQMVLDDLSARLPVVGRLDEEADTIWWQSYDINDRESFYDTVKITGMGILPSGSIFLCGNLEEFSDGFNSVYRPFIMKLDKDGCLEPGCRTSVGLDDITEQLANTIYPNPGNQSFTFQSTSDGVLHIYSLSGLLVKQANVGSGKVSIDMTGQCEGVYLVQFADGNRTKSYKWVKL